MKPKIALISLLTNRHESMTRFYRDVVGFEVALQMDEYVEFKSEGVRFAIAALNVMTQTVGHPSFEEARSGQPFELAFDVNAPEEVDRVYEAWVSKGAVPIQPPADMPWNQRTAFFADPDGNIHELFADLPKSSDAA
jgi:lactoylglutathione lyase